MSTMMHVMLGIVGAMGRAMERHIHRLLVEQDASAKTPGAPANP